MPVQETPLTVRELRCPECSGLADAPGSPEGGAVMARSAGEQAEPVNSGRAEAGTEAQRTSLVSVPQGPGVPRETRRGQVDKRLVVARPQPSQENQR